MIMVAPSRTILTLSVCLWLLGGGAVRAQAPAAPEAVKVEMGVGGLVGVVTDGALEAGQREAAADRLIALCPDPLAMTAVDRLLRSDPADDRSRALLLEAVVRAHGADPSLWGIVRDLAMERSGVRAQAIAACGVFRTRASARVLVGLLNSDQQAEAARALAALSGRDDLNADPVRWRAWLERVEGLDEAAWAQELVASLGGRVERASRAAATLRSDLVEAYRRLHLGTPQEERSALLAELLRHRQGAVRALGFDLASREISSGAALGPEVAEAATGLLTSTDAAARAQGAALVTRLAPPTAGPAVLAALVKETDPSAADPLLRAAARWPDAAVLPVAMVWMESDRTADAASEAAWAVLERGLLTDEEARGRLLAVLRGRGPARLGAAGLKLLVELGDEADTQAVAALLADERTKRAAADALTRRPDGVRILTATVQLDGSLFGHAVRAVSLHEPTAMNFRLLQAATPADPSERVPRLLELARVMPTRELVAATERLDSADPLCESLLVLLADPAWKSDDPGERARGLVRLAEIRVDSGRAESALSVLPARESLDPGSPLAGRVERVHLLASLVLGRMEDAERCTAPASVWLEGLERVTGAEAVRAVAERIEAKFGSVLTAAERSRLASLRARSDATGRPGPGGVDTAGAGATTDG